MTPKLTIRHRQNSNTIPTTMWMIVELAKDPALLEAVREEVATTYVTDPETGKRTFDIQKLAILPLLQSVFTETLRLRMNFNIIRQVNEPFAVDGYTLKKGAMLQAPMMVAHYDEAVWGNAGHPASEFWAERHIKYVDETDGSGNVCRKRTFAMAGRPSSYFPFGTLLTLSIPHSQKASFFPMRVTHNSSSRWRSTRVSRPTFLQARNHDDDWPFGLQIRH